MSDCSYIIDRSTLAGPAIFVFDAHVTIHNPKEFAESGDGDWIQRSSLQASHACRPCTEPERVTTDKQSFRTPSQESVEKEVERYGQPRSGDDGGIGAY